MNILVTGAHGQVGHAFYELSKSRTGDRFWFVDREDFDLTDVAQMTAFFADKAIDFVFNCAAYTAVDKAESEPELADAINHLGVRHLAELCAQKGAHLIHYSTDYVYGGMLNTPIQEDQATRPLSVYGKTKLAGERAAQQANPQTTIIRTSWVYSLTGHNFLKSMLRLGAERTELNVVVDQIGTPTFAGDLAEATLIMADKIAAKKSKNSSFCDTFHYSNLGVCSWYDFAVEIMYSANLPCKIHPIPSSSYPTPVERPAFSVLDKRKISTVFGLEIPFWRRSLLKTIEKNGSILLDKTM